MLKHITDGNKVYQAMLYSGDEQSHKKMNEWLKECGYPDTHNYLSNIPPNQSWILYNFTTQEIQIRVQEEIDKLFSEIESDVGDYKGKVGQGAYRAIFYEGTPKSFADVLAFCQIYFNTTDTFSKELNLTKEGTWVIYSRFCMTLTKASSREFHEEYTKEVKRYAPYYPVVSEVEAVQFHGDATMAFDIIQRLEGDAVFFSDSAAIAIPKSYIDTPKYLAVSGNWILFHDDGSVVVMTDSDFKERYTTDFPDMRF